MTELPAPLWVILPDHSQAVRLWFDAGDHVSASSLLFMRFATFSVASARALDGDDWAWGLFDGGDAGWQPLGMWHDRVCELRGELKWDGCINWETNPRHMIHACSPRHVDEIRDLFATIFHIGKRHMDLLGDAVPPLPDVAIEKREEE